MALDSYDDLKTAIEQHLDTDVLNDQIPDFIRLAEDLHRREVRIREMLVRSQATIDDRYIATPTGFLQMKTLRLLTSPRVKTLRYVTLDLMNEERREEGTFMPELYTVHAELEFDCDPDQDYVGEMIFYAAPDRLSDANQTNAVLEVSPSLYLYGALLHTAPYLLHDERIPVWSGFYTNARDGVNAAARKDMGGPVVAQVKRGLP